MPDSKDHPLRGIFLIVAAVAVFSLMNAAAKYASAVHHPVEILFWRSLIPLCFMLVYMGATGRFHLLKTAHPGLQAVRAIAGTMVMLLSFWAYALLPMANTSALLFTSPLLVTALSPLFLKEKPGPLRFAAVAVGFCGVLLILRPGSGIIPFLAIIIVVGDVLSLAVNDIVLRIVGRVDSALTTSFWMLAVSTGATGLFMPWLGKMPDASMWPALVACGILGGIGQMLRVQSFRHAQASLLAPFNYTAIIWTTLLGFLFWGEAPGSAVIAGAAIIIAANLFILWREKRR